MAHVKNLGPAVAEPTVANHQRLFACGELASYSLHAKGAAARHQHRRLGVVNLFEDAGNIGHHALKALRHMVQGTVGVNHRKLKKAIRINVGQQAGHRTLRV